MSPAPVKPIMTEICAGLAFFSPFQRWAPRMGQREAMERGGRPWGGGGGVVLFFKKELWRCMWSEALQGAQDGEVKQRGPSLWRTAHTFILHGSVPLIPPHPPASCPSMLQNRVHFHAKRPSTVSACSQPHVRVSMAGCVAVCRLKVQIQAPAYTAWTFSPQGKTSRISQPLPGSPPLLDARCASRQLHLSGVDAKTAAASSFPSFHLSVLSPFSFLRSVILLVCTFFLHGRI